MGDAFDVSGKSILLGDDEWIILLGLARTVEVLKMRQVGLARTGEEAVALALRERPQFILLDIHLAGMDGIEAARQILAVYPACVVMMSGNTAEETRQRAYEAGVSLFLPKPFGWEELPVHLEQAFTAFSTRQCQ
jgi:CheY-like chemotaxis protein